MGGFPKIKQRLLTPRRYYSEWRKEISRISLPVEILGDSVPFGQVFDSIKCLPATRRDSLEIPLSESFSLRGISLPESRSRLYQGSRSRSDNFVCKSTPPLFQTPQPRIDEIDISPLPLTSDRRGWGFPPLEIDFFTPDWISFPLLPRIGWDWYSHPCQGNDILEVRNLEAKKENNLGRK